VKEVEKIRSWVSATRRLARVDLPAPEGAERTKMDPVWVKATPAFHLSGKAPLWPPPGDRILKLPPKGLAGFRGWALGGDRFRQVDAGVRSAGGG